MTLLADTHRAFVEDMFVYSAKYENGCQQYSLLNTLWYLKYIFPERSYWDSGFQFIYFYNLYKPINQRKTQIIKPFGTNVYVGISCFALCVRWSKYYYTVTCFGYSTRWITSRCQGCSGSLLRFASTHIQSSISQLLLISYNPISRFLFNCISANAGLQLSTTLWGVVIRKCSTVQSISSSKQ
jgi:hypothetical protein